MPGDEADAVEIGSALAEGGTMAHTRTGDDEDSGTSHVRSPTQVEIVAVERDGRIEAAEAHEQIGPHQLATTGHDEHVAHRVVLLLIELT